MQLIDWLDGILLAAAAVIVAVVLLTRLRHTRLTAAQYFCRMLYWCAVRLMAHARAYDKYLLTYRRERQRILPFNEERKIFDDLARALTYEPLEGGAPQA